MSIPKTNFLKTIGPGIIVAATGVGAGDLIAAAVSGAKYGYALIWAVVLGAVLKFVLNEGISRYQLVSGQSVLQGWKQHLPTVVSGYFVVYLFLWGFIVAAALMAACGLAAHAIFPQLSVAAWGIIHTMVALVIVWFGKFKVVERLMHLFIGMMFVVTLACALMLKPDLVAVLKSAVVPSVPEGSVKFILGVIGGVGGSVTLLSYGYWLREKKWQGKTYLKRSRIDLAVAYILTAIFGIAVMIISAGVKPEVMTGSKMVIGLANELEHVLGAGGKWIFLVGFWGAVFSSMVGVWQGIPYLFADFRKRDQEPQGEISQSKNYRMFLLFLALPPAVLLFASKPVWLVILYAVAGSFFMPYLSLTLMVLNNKYKLLKEEVNSWITNALFVLSLVVFLYLLVVEILSRL